MSSFFKYSLACRIVFLISILVFIGIGLGIAVTAAINIIAKGYDIRQAILILGGSFIICLLGSLFAVYCAKNS